jgi:hypothetical protein
LCVHASLITVLQIIRSIGDLPAVRTKTVDEYDVRAVGVALARNGVTAPKLIRGMGAMFERGKGATCHNERSARRTCSKDKDFPFIVAVIDRQHDVPL